MPEVSGEILILNFHGIGTPAVAVPAEETPYWITRDMFASILEEASNKTVSRQLQFTFDDGNRSDLEIAVPLLKEHQLQATFFVLTGRIGSNGYLADRDIRELLMLGMKVGLHGRHHIDWRYATPKELTDETHYAKKELSEVCGSEIREVSIPFGAYNRRVLQALSSKEFDAVYTSDGGTASSSSRIRARQTIRSDMSKVCISDFINGKETLHAKIRRMISISLKRYVY